MRASAKSNALTIGLILLGIGLRYSQLGFVSDDLKIAFIPWYEAVAGRGFAAVGESFYTYSSFLIFLYWLMSFLGSVFTSLILVKIPVLLFELALAAGFGKLVSGFSGLEKRREIFWRSFALVYLLPTVILNGAAWGQCDALYGAGVIWAVAFLCAPNGPLSLKSHVAFGAALVFKLQCIFIAPVYLVLYLKKKANPLHLLWIPVVYGVGMIPGLLAGRTPASLALVYLDQSTVFRSLTMNAPNLYTWIPNEYYAVVYPVGVVLAALVLADSAFQFAKRNAILSPHRILAIAAFFAWLAPNLLPKMHERYFFSAEILILAVALTTPIGKRWIAWTMTAIFQVVTLSSYARYLYRTDLLPPEVLPIFHILIAGLWFMYFRELKHAELKTSHPIDA